MKRFSWTRLGWAILPLAILGALMALDFPICPFRNLFGVPCPGCGLTRATGSMLTGDLASMLVFHPLAPIVTPLVLFVVVRSILVHAGAVPSSWDPLARVPSAAWMVFAVLLVGLWGLRMAGMFGGLPDPVDLTQGWIYLAVAFLISPLTG